MVLRADVLLSLQDHGVRKVSDILINIHLPVRSNNHVFILNYFDLQVNDFQPHIGEMGLLGSPLVYVEPLFFHPFSSPFYGRGLPAKNVTSASNFQSVPLTFN